MKKISKKKAWVSSLALGILVFSAFAFQPPQNQKPPRSEIKLKVLPKDISHEDLMKVMHGFEDALNYKCSDCHARSKTDPSKLDFASYDNHHKQTALEMMKMVEKINKKHFGIKGKFADNYVQNTYKVTCYTCHHGASEPAINIPADEMKEGK